MTWRAQPSRNPLSDEGHAHRTHGRDHIHAGRVPGHTRGSRPRPLPPHHSLLRAARPSSERPHTRRRVRSSGAGTAREAATAAVGSVLAQVLRRRSASRPGRPQHALGWSHATGTAREAATAAVGSVLAQVLRRRSASRPGRPQHALGWSHATGANWRQGARCAGPLRKLSRRVPRSRITFAARTRERVAVLRSVSLQSLTAPLVIRPDSAAWADAENWANETPLERYSMIARPPSENAF